MLATLHGSQPKSADRIYLVSGHLDSRCTDVLDFTCDAPGADDDASGVAAVLELARVMSKHSFDATIIFAAFSGEEQHLRCARRDRDGNRSVVTFPVPAT